MSWSHFQRVLKVSNENARMYYLKEAAENMWSVRTLDRNISTLYYDRLIASADKDVVKNEMLEKMQKSSFNPNDFMKNLTVLEF